MVNRYVVGFGINLEDKEVVLIRKNRPHWQRGFLNGGGGKVELSELSGAAMAREFEEETGFPSYPESWLYVVSLQAPEADIEFFTRRFYGSLRDTVRSTTDEIICIRSVETPDYGSGAGIVPNLKWVIPMSVAVLQGKLWPHDNNLIMGTTPGGF